MKKVLSIVSACFVLACVMVMAIAPVSAAPVEEDVLAELGSMSKEEALEQLDEVPDPEILAQPKGAPKEEIVKKAKELIPAAYQAEYIPMIENTLQQVDVTVEQAAVVIKKMQNAKAAVKEDKGDSLSRYTKEEQKAVMNEVKAAAKTLGLEVVVEPVAEEKQDHAGDVAVVIKKKDTATGENKVISNIDLDVKKTDSAVDYTMIVAAAGLAIVAAVSAVYGKKLVASR